MGICSVNSIKKIPFISITDPKLVGLKDRDGDGYISVKEAAWWVAIRYSAARSKVLKSVFSTCGQFNKAVAIRKLKSIRTQTNKDIKLVSRLFGKCSANVKRLIQADISRSEYGTITKVFSAAAKRGVGSLGVTSDMYSGRVAYVATGSGADKAGLKVGDKIFSIDGVKREESREYLEAMKRKRAASYVRSFVFKKRFLGVRFKKSMLEVSYGKCGSVANVVIERGGKRMTLKIKRGVG